MFSGIIEELGVVHRITKRPNASSIEIRARKVLEDTKPGDSIAVNGACLTVVKCIKDSLDFEIIPQTLKVTNLGRLRISDKVNLERSLRVGDRISGHFVTGHIDCVGVIRKITRARGNIGFEIGVPVSFMKYCLPKGSVAVEGISLTLADTLSDTFTVYIIPHTLEHTTLSAKSPSDKVNIEFDILAKRASV